jgi:hypothetical protein
MAACSRWSSAVSNAPNERSDSSSAARSHSDLLGDAITVLENVKLDDPSACIDTEDAANRVATALGYLRMIGTHHSLALVEYARQRSVREDVVEALDELKDLVKPRGAFDDEENMT